MSIPDFFVLLNSAKNEKNPKIVLLSRAFLQAIFYRKIPFSFYEGRHPLYNLFKVDGHGLYSYLPLQYVFQNHSVKQIYSCN